MLSYGMALVSWKCHCDQRVADGDTLSLVTPGRQRFFTPTNIKSKITPKVIRLCRPAGTNPLLKFGCIITTDLINNNHLYKEMLVSFERWYSGKCFQNPRCSWFDSEYKFTRQPTEAVGRTLHISCVKVESDPDVDSCRFALNGAVFTVNASVAKFVRVVYTCIISESLSYLAFTDAVYECCLTRSLNLDCW